MFGFIFRFIFGCMMFVMVVGIAGIATCAHVVHEVENYNKPAAAPIVAAQSVAHKHKHVAQ